MLKERRKIENYKILFLLKRASLSISLFNFTAFNFPIFRLQIRLYLIERSGRIASLKTENFSLILWLFFHLPSLNPLNDDGNTKKNHKAFKFLHFAANDNEFDITGILKGDIYIVIMWDRR